FEPWVELAAAWTAAAGGDSLRGARHARAAAAVARDRGDHAFEATALYDAARLGSPRPVRRRLDELTGLLPGPAAPVLAAAATALASGDATALDGTAAAFEDLGMPLLAAEAATTAALAHQRAGRAVAAVRSREHAASARLECPLARTPLLLVERLVGLTPRERDIAAMAGEGLSSPAIARRLELSVRTVDNHLGRVYAKLGVTGRRALRAVLQPRGTR
ncbi:helix-turn-helix transcriptional regulator, partial [Saccharothrix coeruleofusca]